MENYFNAIIGDEPEAQGDDDWKIRVMTRGADREIQEYIREWRAIRRNQAEKDDGNNVAQRQKWKNASVRSDELKHKRLPRTEQRLRTDFIDYRLWTLLNMNGGRIEQATIPALFASEFKANLTLRQAEESVKRIEDAGRIKVKYSYDTRGKRIIIYRSIANT
jgi:hypothetical protein